MATLLVRNLDPDLVRRLKERARAHGRSVEAEHRAILAEALGGSVDTEEWIARVRRGPLADLTDETWSEILARDDRGRSLDWP